MIAAPLAAWLSLLAATPAPGGPCKFTPGGAIACAGEAPEGLVGTGRSVVRTRPDGFAFHTGGDARGRLRLRAGERAIELAAPDVRSTFFPGGVAYQLEVAGLSVEVLHGALPSAAYVVAVRVAGARGALALEVEEEGAPALAPGGRVPFPLRAGRGTVVLAAGGTAPASFEALRRAFAAPYRGGLSLETPLAALDSSLAFHRFLLDLGFAGSFHVCEIFRWKDVWSRDLGSGLVPGAQVAGRFAAARATLEYDLARHAAARPRGLKVTEDPSQGGSAEGVSWLTRAVWREYLLTGDRKFLARAAEALRPWVQAWLDRDHAGSGLLVDDTEWMDHSRFFLFPDGARVLYSNALFAGLLGTFAQVEQELGDGAAAARLVAARGRFVQALNALLWNEARGQYDNLLLWGLRDERTAQENALAVLQGVVPSDRVARALGALRERTWKPAGSVTIAPPMAHVDLTNDHNHKMWPWWNAVEARARFRHGDVEGGLHLLERSAATLLDRHYPGLIEELTSPEGATEGGNAFLTAAGSFLDAVQEGLLGVEILEPGRARLRVEPHAPASWRHWSARLPLPGGELLLQVRGGPLTVRVTDPAVRVVEVPAGARVIGARAAPLSAPAVLAPQAWAAPAPEPLPAPRPRRAALFREEGIPSSDLPGLPARRVGAEALAALDPADVEALLVAGNALPRRTRGGADVPAALASYLDRGGALVFLGATAHERGTMGETAGIVDWYEHLPAAHLAAIGGWKVRASDGNATPRERERGLAEGWQRPELADGDWRNAVVPGPWEAQLGSGHDGWGWYRARFALPAEARGKPVVLRLGKVDDDDWTYVNGLLVGETRGHQRVRRYAIAPGDPAYAALRFGGDNVVAVQVRDHGGLGGLWEGTPAAGVESGERAWTPVSPVDGVASEAPVRLGVVSWGPGDFFSSWEARRGAFGFRVDGRGVRFVGPLADLPPLDGPVAEAFTDFAVSRPWSFEPLAFTATRRGLLLPDAGERYPCAVRLVDRGTSGEILLVAEAIARSPAGARLLERLGIR